MEGRKLNKNIRNIIEKLMNGETLHEYTWTGAINITKGIFHKSVYMFHQLF